MYQSTTAFGTLVQQDSRTFKCLLTYGETSITTVRSIKFTGGSEGEDDFSLGSTMSQYIEVTIPGKGLVVEGTEMLLQIGMDVNGKTEYIPMGYFTAGKPQKADDQITFTAYDRMMNTERTFSMDGTTTNTVAVLKQIADITGVPVVTSGLTAISIKVPKGYSCREVLSYVAQLYGAFAVCNRRGQIELHTYVDSDYKVKTSRYWGNFEHNDYAFDVSKFVCFTGQDKNGKSISIFSGSGARSVSFSNPFMTQTVLNNILASFKNFSYMPGTLKMMGDPRLDPWDILTVADLSGNTYKVPIMKLDWEYDGGLTYSVEAVGLSEEETNADYKGPQTKEMERYYAQLVMIDRAMINKLDVETAKITYASIKELDVVKENAEEINAKKANIDLANVNNAWIEKGVLKDGSIGSAAIHEGAVTNAKIADATIEAAKIKSINADSIVAGTIKTERLIITGPDGQDSIVKAINIANGVSEAEVNGQKIQAASIDVVDLSAFQAKIAQFDMSQNAIYSGKLAINDPTSGVYISTTGLGLGDGALTSKKESPIQMYADGVFKLKGNTNMYVKFATLTILSNYINTPMTFKLVSRGWETSNVQIMFKSINDPDPGLDWFRADGTVPLWIKKSGTSKWDLYMQKNEPWGSCIIYNFVMSDRHADVTWTTDQVAAIPNGAVKVALLSADANAISRISAAETEISNNKKQIALKASQTEVTNLKGALGDLSVYTNKKTTMVQDITGWQYTWDTVISTDAAEIASHKDYITFDKGNIILGDSASASKLKLTKDSIQFKGTSDTAITPDSDATAWITGKVFHINSGEIESSLKFGNILMKPTKNGIQIGNKAEFGERVRIGYPLSSNMQYTYSDCPLVVGSNTNTIGDYPWFAVDDGYAFVRNGIITPGDFIIKFGEYTLDRPNGGKFSGTLRPYYRADDVINMEFYVNGYVTSNKQEVIFLIPLSRPIMSTPVSISSINGLTIRQNGKYIYGSTASKPIKPSSYTATVIGGRNGLNVRAKIVMGSNEGFTDNEISKIVNNDTCAITASIKISFD